MSTKSIDTSTVNNGTLYIVATPIGNLGDITQRALDTLKLADRIYAEDTRNTRKLLTHFGIKGDLQALHDHNERHKVNTIKQWLDDGENIALVSDAGTPLISDPGYHLVSELGELGYQIIPIPGASAIVTALSIAGLPTDRFTFEGFLPRTSSARKNFFTERQNETATWVFYESSHRILASLEDLTEILSGDRRVVVALELTKLFETVVNDTLDNVLEKVRNDKNMQKGEFVVLVEGAVVAKNAAEITEEQKTILSILLKQCSIKTAVAMAVEITGARKKVLYQVALDMKEN